MSKLVVKTANDCTNLTVKDLEPGTFAIIEGGDIVFVFESPIFSSFMHDINRKRMITLNQKNGFWSDVEESSLIVRKILEPGTLLEVQES